MRYWVFAYYQYYPSGGMNDFNCRFESLDAAIKHAQFLSANHDHVVVFDAEEFEHVWIKP
jgi:hypothetical protein